MNIPNIQNNNTSLLKKISMALFATLPLLAWYSIPFPVSLGYAILLCLSAYTIFMSKFKINVFPPILGVLFIYISLIWIYQHNFELRTLIPPGGWNFFIFILSLLLGILNFDLKYFKKYMRWVVLISGILFWIQFSLKIAIGSQIFCFVPNLTGSFTYEGLSYAELVGYHLASSRPCSIFMEPSYMAHYFISYLTIMWFGDDFKDKWINKEIIFIVLTLVALKSGSGLIALAVLISIKVFSMFKTYTTTKRIMLIFLVIPLILGTVFFYISTEMGAEMFSRIDEFGIEGSSGYTRVIGGYMMFESLNFKEQLVGIIDAQERFGIMHDKGIIFFANGVQTILLTLGYIGAILYFFFYVVLFRKTSLISKSCIITLLVISLIESNYLNPYMMLLTIIPCADYYKKGFKL